MKDITRKLKFYDFIYQFLIKNNKIYYLITNK